MPETQVLGEVEGVDIRVDVSQERNQVVTAADTVTSILQHAMKNRVVCLHL